MTGVVAAAAPLVVSAPAGVLTTRRVSRRDGQKAATLSTRWYIPGCSAGITLT